MKLGGVKYVGVIRIVSHVHQLLLIRFTQQNLCCINTQIYKDAATKLQLQIGPSLI